MFSFGSQYPSFLPSFFSLSRPLSHPRAASLYSSTNVRKHGSGESAKKMDTGYGGGGGGNANICASFPPVFSSAAATAVAFFPWAKLNRSRRIGRKGSAGGARTKKKEREDEDMMMRRRGSGLLFFQHVVDSRNRSFPAP